MNPSRHDSFATRLGDRGSRNLWRLWIEDTGLARLSRNNFTPGTPLTITRRAGCGLIIAPAAVSTCHVSRRRGCGVLSYEARDLGDVFPSPEIRVRVHVGRLFVVPSLRVHAVSGLRAAERWTVTGSTLTTPAGACDIRTPRPLRLEPTAATIDADLSEANLVYVTELIGTHRPARVVIHGAAVAVTVAGQFLCACNYSAGANAGEFVR